MSEARAPRPDGPAPIPREKPGTVEERRQRAADLFAPFFDQLAAPAVELAAARQQLAAVRCIDGQPGLAAAQDRHRRAHRAAVKARRAAYHPPSLPGARPSKIAKSARVWARLGRPIAEWTAQICPLLGMGAQRCQGKRCVFMIDDGPRGVCLKVAQAWSEVTDPA